VVKCKDRLEFPNPLNVCDEALPWTLQRFMAAVIKCAICESGWLLWVSGFESDGRGQP